MSSNSDLEGTDFWEEVMFVLQGLSQILELKLSVVFLTGVSDARMEKRTECRISRQLS